MAWQIKSCSRRCGRFVVVSTQCGRRQRQTPCHFRWRAWGGMEWSGREGCGGASEEAPGIILFLLCCCSLEEEDISYLLLNRFALNVTYHSSSTSFAIRRRCHSGIGHKTWFLSVIVLETQSEGETDWLTATEKQSDRITINAKWRKCTKWLVSACTYCVKEH